MHQPDQPRPLLSLDDHLQRRRGGAIIDAFAPVQLRRLVAEYDTAWLPGFDALHAAATP